jgi:hypothetical protein
MVLNYFLSARQESEAERASRAFEDRLSGLRKTLEASHAASVEELVENHRGPLWIKPKLLMRIDCEL